MVVIPTALRAVQRVLGPYLRNLPGPAGHRVLMVGTGAVALADSRPDRPVDAGLATALRGSPRTGDGAYADGAAHFSNWRFAAHQWNVVDSVRTSVLYSPIDGWQRTLPCDLLLALLPAGGLIVMLADRAGRTAESARQASEAKSAFLASMSHELRTPMTTVIGFGGMLHQGRLGELSERQHEVIGHIHTSSKHLNHLIGEVLDLSRVEEGRMTFHPEDMLTHLLVAEVADGMSGLAADRGVEIAVDAPDVGISHLDPGRFKQVLYNLIGNALKFTEAGGTVAVVLRRAEHGELAVDVTDDGAGIATEDLDKIFLPFEQGGDHRNGGAGLRLAVSRRIVNAQGGQISVLWAPRRGRDLHGHAAGEPMSATVLVVEDHDLNRRLLTMLVEGEGHVVQEAATLADVRRQVAEAVPDIILMDVNLPDGDGLDFVARLRVDHRFDDVRIYAVTAYLMGETHDRAMAAGCDGLFEKPIDTDKLLPALRGVR